MQIVELWDGGYVLYQRYNGVNFQTSDLIYNTSVAAKYETEYNIKVYLNIDGKAYYADDTSVYEFESIGCLEKALKEIFSHTASQEILYKKNKFGKDFPEYSKQIADDLLCKLKIPKQNYNVSLLKKVEKGINSIANPYKF